MDFHLEVRYFSFMELLVFIEFSFLKLKQVNTEIKFKISYDVNKMQLNYAMRNIFLEIKNEIPLIKFPIAFLKNPFSCKLLTLCWVYIDFKIFSSFVQSSNEISQFLADILVLKCLADFLVLQ